VVVLKNGKRLCGSGGAILNQALLQSKSYFEVKIQQTGHWSVGLCTLNADLNKTRGGLDKYSWCLNAENLIMNDGSVIYDLNEIYSSNNDALSNLDTEQLLPVLSNNKSDITNILPSTSTSPRSVLPQEMDIIGITYDHIELNFYLNGKNLNVPTLIKLSNSQPSNGEYNSNEIYPCLFVDDGAILDLIVDNFNFQIPSGYDKIMVEQTLL
jgi:SPRY domain